MKVIIHCRHIAISGLLCVGLSGLAGDTSRADTPADVPVVHNPAVPPTVQTWRLQEVWRLSGDDDDAPLLGVIREARSDTDGNVYLLDRQLCHVLVVSRTGEFLRTLGREGEGPGEVRRPRDLVMFEDGTVGLLEGFPGKIVRVAHDGTPARNVEPSGGSGFFSRARAARDVLVVAGQVMDLTPRDASRRVHDHFIARISLEGEELQRYLAKTIVTRFDPAVYDEREAFFPSHAWDLTPNGTLVLATERDLYRLEFRAPDGRLLRVSERDFTSYRRSADDSRKVADGVTYSVNGRIVEVKTNILDTPPALRGVQVMDDGTIWVSSCFAEHDLPENVYRRYDVLGPDGVLRAEVHLVCDGDREEDALIPLADGRFVLVRNATSALQAMYPGSRQQDDEDAAEAADDEDVELEVICLEHVSDE